MTRLNTFPARTAPFPPLRRSHLLVVLLFTLPVVLTAQPLVSWNVNGLDAQEAGTLQGTLATHLSLGALGLGSGASASATNHTFGGTGFDQTTLSGALNDGDYLSFTIAPVEGYTASIGSITANIGIGSTTGFNVALLSSATGGFAEGNELWTYEFSSTTPPPQSITLSSVTGLQSISGTIDFRLYGWRDSAGTSTFRIRDLSGADLSISGTTAPSAIPEPSTYAAILGGVSLAGVIVYRRRRNR